MHCEIPHHPEQILSWEQADTASWPCQLAIKDFEIEVGIETEDSMK